MTDVTVDGTPPPRYSSIATIAGPVVVGIGIVVLLGWMLDVEVLKSLVPGMIVMIPNTALAFVAVGASLWLLRRPRAAGGAALRAGRIMAVFVTVVGLVMMVERMTGWDLGIDLLLFADSVRRYPYMPPGLMATNSTVCFTLAGLALLTLDWEPMRERRPSQWMAIAGLVISAVAIVGYIFGARGLYALDRAAGMAFLTATAFFALHVGILFARPDRGGITLLTGANLASSLARRLMGATVAVPILLGWIWLRAREEELISHEGGIALLTVATIAVLTALLLQAASVLRATDRERESLLVRERTAREEAEVARAGAEAANRAKSAFLGTVSHELRTPLNAVIGYTSLMLDGVSGPVSEAHRHQLGRISVSARHLLALIDEILTLTRLDAGKEAVVVVEADIESILRDAASIVEPLAGAKRLTLRVNPPTSPVLIATDTGKVRQILVNLLGNAVKFTDAGEVTVSAHIIDGGEWPGGVALNGGGVRLDVHDTGVGISAADVEKIFDPFWQVEQGMSRRAPGTGLGLSVSRRLARLLDGELTVESDVGRGSTFHVWLPIRATRH